jgi:hypothetical protein
MPPADISLAPLAQALEAWLSDVPKASDALLAASRSLLRPTGLGWPAWLALQSVSFRWTLHSEFDEVDPSWLFGSRVSAREMLDAELQVDLRPVPFGDGPPFLVPVESVFVVMPAVVIGPWPAGEPGPWAPPAAEPERTLLLRLGADETLGIWSPARGKKDPDVDPDRIRARWVRAGITQDIEGDGPWPLELLVGLVAAFSAPTAAPAPAPVLPFDALFTIRPVWTLAREALDATSAMQAWLGGSPRAPLEPPLDGLRSRWHVARRTFRLESLVDRTGQLAPPKNADTFLAPFRLEWDATGAPSVAVELPDLVMTGEVRVELLEKFSQSSEMDDVAGAMNRALGELVVSPDDVRGWCAAERTGAMVLRVDRARRDDHHLLLLTASVRGEPVVALVDSTKTRLDIDKGRWTAKLDDVSLGYVGRLRGAAVEPGNGANGFRSFLGGLLRWRLLFP